MRCGTSAALGLAAASGAALMVALRPDGAEILVLAILTALALGYTAPPVRLSYRGLGELDVATTHSFCAVLCGFLFQGGAWSAPAPWLLSLPLFFAVLPGITLSGVPYRDADRLAGKRTLAVRTGIPGAYLIAAISAVLAAATAIVLAHIGAAGRVFAGIEYAVLPHLAVLLVVLAGHAQGDAGARRIDGLMALALSYVLWFVAIPLWHLLERDPALM
jgi:1,4-dihydroxy-2-naphthoate octaprenyltransferase